MNFEHTDQLCGLAANPALPAHLLDRFIAGADQQLCSHLARRDDLSADQIRVLADRGDGWVLLALLERPDADPTWTMRVAKDPDRTVRSELTARFSLPLDAIRLLAQDSDVVASLARCQALPDNLFEQFARHPDVTVRAAVAANEHTPPTLLRTLVDDEEDVQLALILNDTTPSDALAGFADHPSMLIRWQLARHKGLPREVYEKLAEDPIPGVRCDIARNPAIGEPIMRALAADEFKGAIQDLAQNPEIPLDLLTELAAHTRIGPRLLPRIETATEDELRTLAASTTAQVRMLVTERPDLPAGIVDQLARDSAPAVAKGIAPNPAVPVEQLWQLIERHGQRMYPRIARNPNCTTELLHHLASDPRCPQKAHRVIAKHDNADAETLMLCFRDDQARRYVAGNPNLPPETIVAFLKDPRVADDAAANPSLPRATMADLLGL